ncbi:MAG TPA: hypothetical protein VKG79_13290 [Bryobacteraceae bacterium]|nr:hypothetical protein [Bryobacteraceae bacterium]
MATPTNVVKFPKPSPSSFNKNRPLAKNTLILNQVKHFREMEKKLPLSQHTGIDADAIQTEGQAAEYIAKVTKLLHGKTLTAGGK